VGHAAHALSDGVVWYVPAEHGAHTLAPSTKVSSMPAEHTHCPNVSFHCIEIGHVHTVPFDDMRTSGQVVHVVRSVDVLYMPEVQGKQL